MCDGQSATSLASPLATHAVMCSATCGSVPLFGDDDVVMAFMCWRPFLVLDCHAACATGLCNNCLGRCPQSPEYRGLGCFKAQSAPGPHPSCESLFLSGLSLFDVRPI
jgi:hypothetical protein